MTRAAHPPSRKVGAGIIDVACTVGESYGFARSALLQLAGLHPDDLSDPGARLPSEALVTLVEHVVRQTGDRSFGLRFGQAMELRTQGFWGYLFVSCLSLRQAAGLLVRFSRLRHSGSIRFWEEDGRAVFEWMDDPLLPQHLQPLAGDAFLACFCHNRRRWVPEARGDVQAWLTYPEEPHHKQLRALVGGPITFGAPFNRCCVPASELQARSRAHDPHLFRLALGQLERQLAEFDASGEAGDLPAQVRGYLRARLHDGVSLGRLAGELRLSVRTLRRRLQDSGVSFQELLEQVRYDAAVEHLKHRAEDVARIAERLGYGDPSNFRRAFRRWTGLSPAQFRELHGAAGAQPVSQRPT